MQNSIITECWKPVPGFEGLYEASSLGKIRSLNYLHTGKTKELSPGTAGKGYLSVNLYKDGKRKSFSVQRLIYTTFQGPIPPGMHVDHVNNIKTDNRIENLQLLTPADNVRKAHLGKKGKPHTEETKARMSAAKKGRKLSEGHKAKMAASQRARREREKN